MRPSPSEEFAIAQEVERAAWDAVKDRLPGLPDYSPELWEAWRAAVRQSDEARKRLVGNILPGHKRR